MIYFLQFWHLILDLQSKYFLSFSEYGNKIFHRFSFCQKCQLLLPYWVVAWTNFSLQDKPWAKFSTLEVAACKNMNLLPGVAIQPNLELKTQPKQLLGSLPLVIALLGCGIEAKLCEG